MQDRIYLNNHWSYAKEIDAEIEEVRIPHTNVETPFHYFDENIYQLVSYYSHILDVQKEWEGKSVLLTFEGVAHIAKVYVNNQLVGTHEGGYTAFTFDIEPYLEFTKANTLVVEVDSRESSNIPPFGNVVDYMTYGGIYRDVYVEVKEKIHIQEVFVRTYVVNKLEKILEIDVEINDSVQKGMQFQCYLKKVKDEQSNDSDGELVVQEWIDLGIKDIEEITSTLEVPLIDVELWELDNPVLYDLKVLFMQEPQQEGDEKETYDEKIIRFGFRECAFKNDGFHLNGKKIKLMGLNRHQSYPYVGYAMPKRVQQTDADILKYELGLNAVRTSHYPQSQHFIDRCDEIGLLVFTEIPGWQHIGDEQWKEVALRTVEEMVKQYRNHPSIILWGARINESQDDDAFYKETNRMIHRHDNSRQTGGVRFLKKSKLLEDVYTYNDFSHTGKNAGVEAKASVTSNQNAPYLVTEYNGHMYPTKAFDDEGHRLEHAKRHANVLEGIFARDDISGGFGWCMFDYNTHKDFGSGDHICYHGVMNMFRVPKLAASVYASQGEVRPVLEISSSMDIGEHPGGNIGEVYAFTNGDAVRLYKNDVYVKTFYPNRKNYGHLPHPPILINDFIGELIEKEEGYNHRNAEWIKTVLRALAKYGQYKLPIRYKVKMGFVMLFERLSMEDGLRLYSKYIGNWGVESTTYRFESIKDEKIIAVVEKKTSTRPQIKVMVDTQELHEDISYDVASVRVQVVDEYGQILPYYQGVITYEIKGKLALIGPDMVSAVGGSTGTYVKTVGHSGIGYLIIRGTNMDEVSIPFHITIRKTPKAEKGIELPEE